MEGRFIRVARFIRAGARAAVGRFATVSGADDDDGKVGGGSVLWSIYQAVP
jgi:hypothetical protein